MKYYSKIILGIALLVAKFSVEVSAQILSPSEFLGYPLGTAFTYHHRVLDYFDHVSIASANVRLYEYGRSYERRPLKVAYISSPKNLESLEEIRLNNLQRTGIVSGQEVDSDIVIVWLSYNVHGNEASSSEAAMKVLYELASGENIMSKEWLEHMVIILDPCLNPDGRDRYVNWYNQVANNKPNPSLISREHHERWSSGRSNHYQFDLNRDWVWQTQIESRQRVKLYNDWLPHVHVDFHEQYIDNHYYFAPAAEPMHEVITDWQKEFQRRLGENNAKHFDRNGWLYFTREIFDLLYPGYGDTYPTFNGAIGMTYEMAGNSRSGLAAATEKGDTLTLRDRIEKHFTTSISTLETCFDQRSALISGFSDFYRLNAKAQSSYILQTTSRDKISQLTRLLDAHNIIYKSTVSTKKVKAKDFDTDQKVEIEVNKGDLIVPQDQPKSALVKVLFERNTKLVDSLTYDITAWSLPFVYDIKTYILEDRLSLIDFAPEVVETVKEENYPYAYLLNWTSLEDARFLSAIMQKRIKVNITTRDFQYNGKKYNAGSLIINKIDNIKSVANYHDVIMSLANDFQRELVPLVSGAALSDFDLGSQKVRFIKKPQIALLSGEGINPYNFGELWYFFEQELSYPVDIIQKSMFSQIELNEYDVLILASGAYEELQEEEGFSRLDEWINGGGSLILFDKAISGFLGEDKFALEKNESEKHEEDAVPKLYAFEDQERENLKKYIRGGIIKVDLDNTHPLAYGYEKHYYTLKDNGNSYKFLSDGWNVAYIPISENLVAGFAGSETMKKLNRNLIFGVEQRGRGKVIYFADNPVFRGFWQNGKLFLANAIFFNN